MLYYLYGTVALIEPGLAVVDCGGVGFSCSTTTYTLASLKLGARARLYTYCNIREDAFDIFGFSTKDERDCFTKLIAVSGVGPKAALAILSVLSPDQFRLAVLTQDDKTLTMAQGVGKKMAQRILLELKEKLGAAVEQCGAPLFEYTPNEVKRVVVGDGGAGEPGLFAGGGRRGAQNGRGRANAHRRAARAAGAARNGHKVRRRGYELGFFTGL